MEATIAVTGLRKRFGSTLALDGMTFIVQPGQVTGFVGPNGAGKSTTMRVILGLDAPDQGTALISGQPYPRLRRPLSHIGAMLDAAALQPGRTARNHLLWLAHSQGLSGRRVDEVIERAGLTSAARRKAGGFSLGMRQRLGIAAAMLGDPPVLMFDEPVNGLDAEGVHWIRGLLKSMAAEGRTVFVSSHLMSEMALTADHLIIIGRGRLLADTATDRFVAANARHDVLVRSSRSAELTGLLAERGATVSQQDDGGLSVTGLDAPAVADLAAAHGIPVHELTPRSASLEQAYLDITGDSAEYRAEPLTAEGTGNR